MRSLRTALFGTLILLGVVCARQSNAQDFYTFGFIKEWHDPSGSTVGYAYLGCTGKGAFEGNMTGKPALVSRWMCDPILQKPLPQDCQYQIFFRDQNGGITGRTVVISCDAWINWP